MRVADQDFFSALDELKKFGEIIRACEKSELPSVERLDELGEILGRLERKVGATLFGTPFPTRTMDDKKGEEGLAWRNSQIPRGH